MFGIKRLIAILVISAVGLVGSTSPGLVDTVYALPTSAGSAVDEVTIPYPGYLSDTTGQAADGIYDFTFSLYQAATGGQSLWSETQLGLTVKNGSFATVLGSVTPIPGAALDSGQGWLAVSVRGPGESHFATLTPRQRLSAATSSGPTASAAAGQTCPHDHWGEAWDGGTSTDNGLHLTGRVPWANALFRANNFENGPSVWGVNYSGGNGVRGENKGTGLGIYGQGEKGVGVVGRSAESDGVQGFGGTAGGRGVYGKGDWGVGVYGESENSAALFGTSPHGVGLSVTSSDATMDIIRAFGATGSPDIEFRVANDGEVFADKNFHSGGADFAEMLPAVDGLEAGDVLVMGVDGTLARSGQAYQPTVVGVYSTSPGFVGGSSDDLDLTGKIPLAILGIVPTKASTENGSIAIGDLLVASSTPGHAMKAGLNPPQGTVIGKALGSLDDDTGVIQMLVMLQ